MYTTEGIILKRIDVGETGSLFTIYTKDFGKIRALAQGIKKGEAKLKGHLEPLSLSAISLVTARNGLRLTAAVLQYSFPGVRSSYNKLAAGFYIASLIDREFFEGSPDDTMWQFLKDTFFVIEKEQSERTVLARTLRIFEKELIAHLGYGNSVEVLSKDGSLILLS